MGVVSIITLLLIIRAILKHVRSKNLMAKYQDKEVVDNIMRRQFWQGQTAEQLIDAIGEPEDIDVKVLKTKKKEIWKYDHQRGNRYELRITLDNDVVVGWEQKLD